MKKIHLIIRKCKTQLSRQLLRTSSYTTLIRSESTTGVDDHQHVDSTTNAAVAGEPQGIVFVGSDRKRYVIESKYRTHPLINALIEKSTSIDGDNGVSVINCQVVLFEHLLWMLDENVNLNLASDSVDELADLYYSN